MLLTIISSHAQLSCLSTAKLSSINAQDAKASINDSDLWRKINDTKNDSGKSLAEVAHNTTAVCPKGAESCKGTCTNINTDSNCGGCADKPNPGDHVCKMEQKCCNGICCLPEEICCKGRCTDTYSDPDNCGGCGNLSSGENICQPDETCCSGKCADALHDDDNCGDCGNECPQGTHCVDGECLPSSDTGNGAGGSEEESGDATE